MIENEVVIALKKRYKNISPLIFHRSVEKADNQVELFEILEAIPEPPIYWDENSKRWSKFFDFYNINKAKNILGSMDEDD